MKTEGTTPEGNSGLFHVFDDLSWINNQVISHARKGFENQNRSYNQVLFEYHTLCNYKISWMSEAAFLVSF